MLQPNCQERLRCAYPVDACLYGKNKLVQYLLEAGADPNLAEKKGLLPIIAVFYTPTMLEDDDSLQHHDLIEQMTNIMELLLDNGVDFNSRSFDGKTALMIAAERGYTEIALALIKKGAEIDAIEDCGNWQIPDYEPGMEDNWVESQDLRTALALAVEHGHTNIVAELLKAGANVNILGSKKRLPIDIAIQEGYTEIIELLLNAGAVAATGSIDSSPAALLGASKQGNLDILNSALRAGVSPDTSEPGESQYDLCELEEWQFPFDTSCHKTALMFAAQRGHLEIVDRLILAGANVNLNDQPGENLGKTPLMYAAEADHTKIVELLVKSGAIINARDRMGRTALGYAMSENNVESVKLLDY
jgi:uncharacterized protein